MITVTTNVRVFARRNEVLTVAEVETGRKADGMVN